MMNGGGKSDSAIVAGKPTNKAGQPAAESVEPSAEAEGNASQQSTRRKRPHVLWLVLYSASKSPSPGLSYAFLSSPAFAKAATAASHRRVAVRVACPLALRTGVSRKQPAGGRSAGEGRQGVQTLACRDFLRSRPLSSRKGQRLGCPSRASRWPWTAASGDRPTNRRNRRL